MWDRLEQIRRENQDNHSRLRTDFNDNLNELRSELREEIRTVLAEIKRIDLVLVKVETERRVEAQVVSRRSTWIALAVSIGATVLMKLLELLRQHP